MTRKQIIAFLFLLMLSCINVINIYGDEDEINIQLGHPHNHFDYPIPADQPEVYYNIENQIIIIDGGGEVTYYDVEIESLTTWLTVISTQVNGTYDTIDVSSLAPDEYCITITSPTGHEFEGFFEIE